MAVQAFGQSVGNAYADSEAALGIAAADKQQEQMNALLYGVHWDAASGEFVANAPNNSALAGLNVTSSGTGTGNGTPDNAGNTGALPPFNPYAEIDRSRVQITPTNVPLPGTPQVTAQPIAITTTPIPDPDLQLLAPLPPPPDGNLPAIEQNNRGSIQSQFDEAVKEAGNTNNSLVQRSIFGGLALLSAPVALADQYIINPLENTVSAGAQLLARANLESQSGDTEAAGVDYLRATEYGAAGFIGVGSLFTPAAEANAAAPAVTATGPETGTFVSAAQGTEGAKNLGNFSTPFVTDQGNTVTIQAQNLSFGWNGKVALMGSNMQPVQAASDVLTQQGFDVEIFKGDMIPLDARRQFIEIQQRGITLSPSELTNTLMFKANADWVQGLLDQGYTIMDIGNPLGRNDLGVFYPMEMNTIFPEAPLPIVAPTIPEPLVTPPAVIPAPGNVPSGGGS